MLKSAHGSDYIKQIKKVIVTVLLLLLVVITGSSQKYNSKIGKQYISASAKAAVGLSGLTQTAADRLAERRQELELIARREAHVLVNKEHALPDDYEVELVLLPDGIHKAAKEAYEPLCSMLEAAKEEGLSLKVCSAYRSANYQKRLFDEDVAKFMNWGYSYEEAYEKTAALTMPPGYSEHSTGLAFDIVSQSYQMLNSRQEKTAENQWLQEHCAEYGFILRYPKGKEEITQISYESWHFRYVGVEAAEYIMENGITLEEYLGE